MPHHRPSLSSRFKAGGPDGSRADVAAAAAGVAGAPGGAGAADVADVAGGTHASGAEGAPGGAGAADIAATAACPDDAPARQVDAALRRALHDLQRAEQSAVLCFAQIMRRKLYVDLGYSTIHQYASEALGFSMNRTCRFLRLAEDLERLPRLRKAVAAGEIGWTKAREVVKVAGPSTEAQWLAAAKQTGRRELEGMVARARKERAAHRKSNPGQGTLAVVVSSSALAEAEPRRLSVGQSATGGDGDASATGAEAPAGVRPAEHPLPTAAPLVDEAPAAVVFRLAPIQLARYDMLMENIRKSRVLPAAISREEILLEALEELLAACETRHGGQRRASAAAGDRQDPDAGRGTNGGVDRGVVGESNGGVDRGVVGESNGGVDRGVVGEPNGGVDPDAMGESSGCAAPSGTGDPDDAARTDLTGPGDEVDSGTLPRGKVGSPYKIIIYKCEQCGRATVQTARGEKAISRVDLAAIECDAVVSRPGARNQATVAPSARAAVLARDRHRCRAAGCGETRFLEVHHIVAREAGGSNKPENLVTLCSRCHRLWHERGLGALALRL